MLTIAGLFPFDFSLPASSPGALAAGREKEGELATTSLEFGYLHGKSRCEMLIVGDDSSNGVSSIFYVFFNVCLHSRLSTLRADWRILQLSGWGAAGGTGGDIQVPEK